jgi:hypothetical protein
MGLQPDIARRRVFSFKTCNRCGQSYTKDEFAPTKSIFYADGALPICNGCIESYLLEVEFDWQEVDKLC